MPFYSLFLRKTEEKSPPFHTTVFVFINRFNSNLNFQCWYLSRETKEENQEIDMSYWLNNIKISEQHACVLNDEVADVVIVGCGITGASTAFHLAKNDPTAKYIVVERDVISAGATGRNGGFICPGTSEAFSESVKRYGLTATQSMYNYTVQCTEAVKIFCNDHTITPC